MGFKKPTRNPEIYISEKDMIEFFNLPEKEVKMIIEKQLIKPKYCDGKILYRLTEVMRASLYFQSNDYS